MNNKIIKYIFALLISSYAYSQVDNLTQFENKSSYTFFYYNALNFLDDDSVSTRLDLYIHV
ncbi:MAG: hypothetical protein N3A61_10015, partial [Ignavibacteria bacterium]|nr:hypothetical protein [Ignavibacteria bacterium]